MTSANDTLGTLSRLKRAVIRIDTSISGRFQKSVYLSIAIRNTSKRFVNNYYEAGTIKIAEKMAL